MNHTYCSVYLIKLFIILINLKLRHFCCMVQAAVKCPDSMRHHMPVVVKDEVTLPGVHMTPLDGSYIAARGGH